MPSVAATQADPSEFPQLAGNVEIDTDNGGKWIVKKKFALALFSLLFGYIILVWLLRQVEAVTIAEVAIIMSSLATFTLSVLGLVYAADRAATNSNCGYSTDQEQSEK